MSKSSKITTGRFLYIVLFAFLSLGVLTASAQGNPGDDVDFPDIPLDGGLSLLLVAGAAYGGKKIYDKAKK